MSNETKQGMKKHLVHLRTSIPVDLAFRVEANDEMTDEQLKQAVASWYAGKVGISMMAGDGTKIELNFCDVDMPYAVDMSEEQSPVGWKTPVCGYAVKDCDGHVTKFFHGLVQLSDMETPQYVRVEQPYAFWNEDAWDSITAYGDVGEDDHWMTHKEYCEATEEPYEEDYMNEE